MHGLYVLYWLQEKHLPLAALATILAAGDLGITALEFPTGWFADRCGYRASLVIGSIAQIAGMLCAWLGEGVAGVSASVLLIAIGDAFRSGADQALLFRSCAAIGRAADFQTIEGRTRGLQLTALVALVLLGGAIVEQWGFGAGWIVETAVCGAGLLIACAMIDPSRIDLPIELPETEAAAPRANESTIDPAKIWRFTRIIVPAALLTGVASAATFLAQAAPLAPGRMTLLVAGVTLAEAAGAFAGAELRASLRCQLLVLIASAALAATAFLSQQAFLPGVLALCFLMGIAHPLRAALIQREVDDHVRARAASIASAVDKATATIG